jgi:replicative DNA helicase
MSLESEMSVIGAVLLDNAAYFQADVNPDDFANFYHQNIWSIIQTLSEENSPVDLVTLTTKARELDLLDKCGGIKYFSDLVDYVPTSANIGYYVKQVKKASTSRRIATLGEQLKEIGETAGDPSEAIELVESTLFNFVGDTKAESLAKLSVKAVKEYENRHKQGNKISGVSYGFPWLDRKTGGIHPGQLVIVAGRPSMGKTAFALNIAERSKAKTYILSLETSKQSLTDRLFCQSAKIDLTKFKNGSFAQVDFPEIVNTAGNFQNSNIHIDDSSGLTVTELKQRARRHKIKYGLDLIIIDYLQLMQAKSENRFQEVSMISRQLKALAKDVAPVIALAQLSRNGAGDRAQVEHLRESGQIEQDADLILFPYRESANCEECKAKNEDCGKDHFNLADITIAKQKDGSLGRQDFYWTGRFQSFEEVYKEY